MKFSNLAAAAAAMTALSVGPALAQTAPVTMQPIPNPPEKAAKPHHHKAKHHKKAAAKSDAPAAAAEKK
jgi:hypothetical protein